MDQFGFVKSWSRESNKSEKKVRVDDQGKTVPAEPRPRRGKGEGKGSENRKEQKLGGSEERESERRKVRRIRRKEGYLHADPVGRRI